MIEENKNNYYKIIEALLFSTTHPLSVKDMAEILEIKEKEVNEIIKVMKDDYKDRGINIREVAEGLEMCTNADYHTYIEKLHKIVSSVYLSRACLETLAIIAYNQPITRAEIEEIRGVKTSKLLSTLISGKLIRIAGKSDKLGKPFVYGTTKQFLKHFGIKAIDELPKLEQFKQKLQ